MTKYQEALDRLHRLALYKHELKDNEVIKMCRKDVALMIELVDKVIAKKPINKTKMDDYASRSYENCNIVVCPNCGKRLKLKSKGKYCDKCGQKLDWRENNDSTRNV